MINTTCVGCRRRDASGLTCELCQEPLCKACTHFLDPETFSFLKELPENLRHSRYCDYCHQSAVKPALEAYNETLEKAKSAYFFFKTQKRQPPLLGSAKEIVKVENHPDREETILGLAFQAVQLGYNAVIDGDVVSNKIRNGGYQKSNWNGRGVAAQVDAVKLERDFD